MHQYKLLNKGYFCFGEKINKELFADMSIIFFNFVVPNIL